VKPTPFFSGDSKLLELSEEFIAVISYILPEVFLTNRQQLLHNYFIFIWSDSKKDTEDIKVFRIFSIKQELEIIHRDHFMFLRESFRKSRFTIIFLRERKWPTLQSLAKVSSELLMMAQLRYIIACIPKDITDLIVASDTNID